MSLVSRLLGLRRCGCHRDPHDRRDLTLASAQLVPSVPPVASVDSPAVPVRNQGGTRSCVGFAWATALRLAYLQRGRDPGDLSPLFTYFLARAEHNRENIDGGTHIRSAAKITRRVGLASEQTHPFSVWRVNRSPDWAAYRSAYDRRGVRGYYSIAGLTGAARAAGVRQAIASGLPVVGGWDVDRTFLDDAGSAIVGSMPGKIVGAHAMVLTGYTDGGLFRVRNSWGDRWRDGGGCYLTADLVGDALALWAVDVRP